MDRHTVDHDVVEVAPFPGYAKKDSTAIATFAGNVVYRAYIKIGDVNVLVSGVCCGGERLDSCIVAASYRQVLDVVILHSIQVDGVLITCAAIENGQGACSVGVDRNWRGARSRAVQ